MTRIRRSRHALKVVWNPERKLYEPAVLERHIVKEVIDRLWYQARIKVWIINQPVGGKTAQNEPGIPDLNGWIPRDLPRGLSSPIPLYIEMKRPKGPGRRAGVRSPAQIRFIEEAKAAGCAAFFAESFNDVVRELWSFGVHLKS